MNSILPEANLRKENAYLERNKLLDANFGIIVYSDGSCLTSAPYEDSPPAEFLSGGFFVAAAANGRCAFALTIEGKVISTKQLKKSFDSDFEESVYIVEDEEVVAIAAREQGFAGLRKNGTVFLCSNDGKRMDLWGWDNVVQISCHPLAEYVVGLRNDGTVMLHGGNEFENRVVSEWKNIVHVSAGAAHLAGVKADGRVVAVGTNDAGQCSVSNWTDIKMVSAGVRHTVGLKKNGDAVATVYRGEPEFNGGQCLVNNWHNLLYVSAGLMNSMGIVRDGHIVVTDDLIGDAFTSLFKELEGKKLFKDFAHLAEERKWWIAEEEKRQRRIRHVCQYCGGQFKGVFSKVCIKCGKKKDY